MKKTLLALFLSMQFVACGDNIVESPDAGYSGPDPDDYWDSDAEPEVETLPPDPVLPDPPLPPCTDKHIDLNGHYHKCQHDQVTH